MSNDDDEKYIKYLRDQRRALEDDVEGNPDEDPEFQGIVERAGENAHLPELDQKAEQKTDARKGLSREAVFVRGNPPSITRPCVLGNTRLVTADGVSPTVKGSGVLPVVWWQGDDVETTSVCITLAFPDVQGPPGTQYVGSDTGGATIEPITQVYPATMAVGGPYATKFFFYRPFALIKFGTRGFSATARVDFVKGTRISLSASSVLVSVGLDPAAAGFAPGNMNLAGMLSFLPPARVTPVTSTVYIDQIPSHGSVRVFIPNFAKQLVEIYNTDPAGSLAVQFLPTSTPGANAIGQFTVDGSLMSLIAVGPPAATLPVKPWTLPGDVDSVLVVNNGGTTTDVRLVFALDLG